jgi:hypothetical protein
MPTPDIIRAHRHSIRHRDEVLASPICGCFCCGYIFPPDELDIWVDEREGAGQTAICPNCGIDSVIGSESGYPITAEFLNAMKAHWFSTLMPPPE